MCLKSHNKFYENTIIIINIPNDEILWFSNLIKNVVPVIVISLNVWMKTVLLCMILIIA